MFVLLSFSNSHITATWLTLVSLKIPSPNIAWVVHTGFCNQGNHQVCLQGWPNRCQNHIWTIPHDCFSWWNSDNRNVAWRLEVEFALSLSLLSLCLSLFLVLFIGNISHRKSKGTVICKPEFSFHVFTGLYIRRKWRRGTKLCYLVMLMYAAYLRRFKM